MKNKAIQAFCGFILVMASTACSGVNNDSSQYVNIPPEGWAYKDTLAYPMSLTDSIVAGTFTIAVDHTPQYRYSNLWLELTYASCDNGSTTKICRDTLCMIMADSAGNWRGTGIASSYQLESEPLDVVINSRHEVTLRHIMRTDTLRQIGRVGLFFKAAENTTSQ